MIIIMFKFILKAFNIYFYKKIIYQSVVKNKLLIFSASCVILNSFLNVSYFY